MSVRRTETTFRLDSGYFRADVTGSRATFWKVLGVKSNPTHYSIHANEIDELMEMLHEIRNQFKMALPSED